MHAGMNPDELEKWMKITPGYGGWQIMDPEPSEPPSGFKLPAAMEDGDEESGPYRIAKETMCSVLSFRMPGKRSYISYSTIIHRHVELGSTRRWAAVFAALPFQKI